jgi:hypothetical protein
VREKYVKEEMRESGDNKGVLYDIKKLIIKNLSSFLV